MSIQRAAIQHALEVAKTRSLRGEPWLGVPYGDCAEWIGCGVTEVYGTIRLNLNYGAWFPAIERTSGLLERLEVDGLPVATWFTPAVRLLATGTPEWVFPDLAAFTSDFASILDHLRRVGQPGLEAHSTIESVITVFEKHNTVTNALGRCVAWYLLMNDEETDRARSDLIALTSGTSLWPYYESVLARLASAIKGDLSMEPVVRALRRDSKKHFGGELRLPPRFR